MIWPSAVEHGQIERALAGAEVDKLTVIAEGNSPWLLVTAFIVFRGERKLALWRATGAVHEIGEDGAVKDDPIIPAAWGQH